MWSVLYAQWSPICASKRNDQTISRVTLYSASLQDLLRPANLMNFVSPLLRLTGLDPHHYSGHSFRIGRATSTAVAGLNDYEIKLLGRWSSDCYKRYIRSALNLFLKVPQHRTNIISIGRSLFTSAFRRKCKRKLEKIKTRVWAVRTLLVLNFAILARQYFVGFYFRDFNRQIWKKGKKVV